jgi:hypothetical protein
MSPKPNIFRRLRKGVTNFFWKKKRTLYPPPLKLPDTTAEDAARLRRNRRLPRKTWYKHTVTVTMPDGKKIDIRVFEKYGPVLQGDVRLSKKEELEGVLDSDFFYMVESTTGRPLSPLIRRDRLLMLTVLSERYKDRWDALMDTPSPLYVYREPEDHTPQKYNDRTPGHTPSHTELLIRTAKSTKTLLETAVNARTKRARDKALREATRELPRELLDNLVRKMTPHNAKGRPHLVTKENIHLFLPVPPPEAQGAKVPAVRRKKRKD